MKKGMVAIVIVILVSVMGLFVLVGWQSRLLTAVQRTRSLSDLTAAAYTAESEIYDWAARFRGNYPDLFSPPLDSSMREIRSEILDDGTKMVVQAKTEDGVDTLVVIAERLFSTTKLSLSRTTSEIPLGGVERVEVTLALDCSGSMNQNSDPTCVGGGCEKRIRSLQNALISFVNNIRSSPDANKYAIGLIPFKRGAAWLIGNAPNSDLNAAYNAVKDGLDGGSNWDNVSQAPLCNLASGVLNPCPFASCVGAETNLGTATILANDYFRNNPVDTSSVIRSHILFTDGLPNTAFQDSSCGTPNCVHGESGATNIQCVNPAVDYLKCSLARDNFNWQGGLVGKKPVGVDVYAVTVAERPGGVYVGDPCATPDSEPNKSILTYDKTLCVFRNTNFVNQAYANADATQLSAIFDNIFDQINQSVTEIKIEKIVPPPVN